MQYEITLPADYDMGVIRERVASRGAALDNYPGLGAKAYLIRERGVLGSTINQYAPFYLWVDTDAMGRFLWGGGGFAGIVDSFGRPSVRHWTGVDFRPGAGYARTPRGASRERVAFPAESDPAAAVDQARRRLDERAAMDGAHSVALAVDPRRWQLVCFTLWDDVAPEGAGERYEVLHLSKPAIDALAA